MSDLGVSLADSTGYGVDPNQDEQDGTVFNFGPGSGAGTTTAAANNNSPNNPVTPTATASTGIGTGLSSLSTTTWLIIGGIGLGAIYLWKKRHA